MQISVQHSAFRELHQEAGYTTAIGLARKLGRAQSTVQGWEFLGYRPRARDLTAIAEALGLKLAECVRRIWNETLHDPCPYCGRGVKVWPTYEGGQASLH
jgi:transcriptional regulator with XRE-family HTH domain